MDSKLIDMMVKEIGKSYASGTLRWIKKTKPAEWGKLLTIEQEINLEAKNGDPRTLKRALDSYQKLIITLLSKKFKEKGEGE